MELGLLSEQQIHIHQPGSLIVEACPGSGKTRAIVARYLDRGADSQRGKALLSFTNRAVDEATQRCLSQPHLLKCPNYIGTFDAFLRHFIVTPNMVRRFGRVPLYFPSWDDYAPDKTRVRIGVGSGVSLAAFVWTPSGVIIPNPDQLRREDKNYYHLVEREGLIPSLTKAAERRLEALVNSNILDASTTRYLAFRALDSNKRQLTKRLVNRFQEVIVDEFQDCDENEHAILHLLITSGVDIILVSDPDQSIYGFRGALGEPFETKPGEPKITRIQFTGNFRSTSSICNLATSLRSSGTSPIMSYRGASLGAAHIYLLTGSRDQQRQIFTKLLSEHNIPCSRALVLAHKTVDATELAGGIRPPKLGGAKGDQCAAAVDILSKKANSLQDRISALKELERLCMSALNWPANISNANRRVQLEQLGRSDDWLRVVATHLYLGLRGCNDPDGFGSALRDILRTELAGLPVQVIDALSNNYQRPRPQVWESIASQNFLNEASLPYSTIHKAKGGERRAILLSLPKKVGNRGDVLDDWEQGRSSESRRVLYVGATRAQELLALAVPASSVDQVRRILERDDVPFNQIAPT